MQTQSKDSQSSLSPADALDLLKEGNARFRNNLTANRDLLQQRQDTRDGQWPFAAVLGCIDSRASAELVFDQGIGDIFSARIAGNFLNEDILGSLEFACAVAGAKVIVVLGHSSCGAVKGACDGVELGHLTKMLKNIQPAMSCVATPASAGDRTSQNADFVASVANENVRLTTEAITDQSELLRDLKAKGQIDVVGAMYHLESGEVAFL